MHFQYACAATATSHPEVDLAYKLDKVQDSDLKSVWLQDMQSTFDFDLCCIPDFAHKQ